MQFYKRALLIFIIPLLAFSAHKYYLSMTEIVYDEKENSFQMIINVFMDDIELALNSDYNIDLQLTTKNELKDSDVYFATYLKDKLKFRIEGKEQPFTYLGKEYEGDLVYFYLEINNVKTPQSLEIENTILCQYFKDQQNIVKLTVGEKKMSKILDKINDKALLKF